MLIADRLAVPDGTRALLWDMDGVLLDTLTMDYELVNRLLRPYRTEPVPRHIIREYFPYAIPQFWRLILDSVGLRINPDELIRAHEKERESHAAPVHDGITDILADARVRGVAAAVVSNNPVKDIERMLESAGLRDYFAVVVGIDDPPIAKKPAPDCYLAAARRLGDPEPRAAVEDSLLGAQAAHAAGCFTVGVATGAAGFEALSASPYVDRCYRSFARA
jgi:HAD superfamily hydrolase (TIGR01509 family)